MNFSSFSGPTAVRGVVLPARAAYLVAANSRSGVRRAVQEASSRWGGATEPIIPVRKNGRVDRLWKQVLGAAKVDGVVNVDSGEAGEKAAAALGLTTVPIDDIDLWGTTSASLHPLCVTGFRQPQAPVIASAADAPLWEAVAAGDITDEHARQLRELDVGLYRGQPDGIGRAQLGRGATLLDRTLVQFEEHWAMDLPPAGPAVVWITAPNGVRDCVAFWNVRALRSLRFAYTPMVLLPDRDVEHWIEYAQQLHHTLARPADFAPDVLVISAGVREERRSAVADLLGLTRTGDKVRSGRSTPPRPVRTPPFTYRDNISPWGFVLNQREYGKVSQAQMYVHEGKATVRVVSPVTFSDTGGGTLVRLDSDALDGLPRRQVIAEAIHPSATWSGKWLQLNSVAAPEYEFPLVVPGLPECVMLLLRQRATEHQLSDKGRLGAALLRDIDVTCLLEPGIAEAITALTTERAPALERELRLARDKGLPENDVVALAAKWGGRHERRHRFAGDIGGARIVPALEQLCRLDWAERGVQAECEHCRLDHFVPLGSVTGGATCPGCRSAATYTATGAGLGVRYRLNTFVDRASDQGVIPHLLAIAALVRRVPHVYLLAGTNLRFPDGNAPEVDLVGVVDGQVAAGEVKTKSRDFTRKEIAATVDQARRLDADVCIFAVEDTMPDDLRNAATAAAKRLDVLLLDHTDLRPARR